MLTLDTTAQTLEAKLDAPVGVQWAILTSWADTKIQSVILNGQSPDLGTSATTTNDTTAVTIVAAPAARAQREIGSVIIRNSSASTGTVTVTFNNGGTRTDFLSVLMLAGDTLEYSGSWNVKDASGAIKSTVTTNEVTTLDGTAGGVLSGTYPNPGFAVDMATQTELDAVDTAKANKAITITAGTGLSGGGDLSANRTIDLDDTAVTPGAYTNASITVDQQGRITAATSGSGIPDGGTTGQILTKISDTDFDADWEDAPAGYSDEQAQDAVGTILADSASINFTYTDGTPEITAVAIFGSGAGTVCEGNDSRISSLGTVSTLASDTDGTLAANSDVRVATQKATKTYVDNAVTGLLDLKGSTDCSANPNYPAASKGDTYYVSVAGKIGGASGKSVDAGDTYIASADNAGGDEASVGTSWFVLEHNLSGVALTSGTLAQFAATTSAQLRTVLSDETGTGAAYFQGGDIGTPSAGVATNLTGTASGLTAGNVTTNANLTGGVTSVGNAATVVTNANLTGDVTSVGNATTVANDAITNAKAANMTQSTFKMRAALSGTGDPIDGTVAQATTALKGITSSTLAVGNDPRFTRIIVVDAAATTNVSVSSAPSSIGGIFDVDFYPLSSGSVYPSIAFLSAQTDKKQNGPWEYNGAGVALTRPDYWANGSSQEEVTLFVVSPAALRTNVATSTKHGKIYCGYNAAYQIYGTPEISSFVVGTDELTVTEAFNPPDASITLAKMANLAQDQFIVRTTGSTGVPQTATVTAAARTVLDDTTVSAMVDTLGGASAIGTGALIRATAVPSATPGGRLTLTTGVPVTTSDVTGATNIYYTPYVHNKIQLWDGTNWIAITFTEYTLALGTLTSGKPYDVFARLNSGALALDVLVWTDAVTRATAVTLQDGRYCKSGDKTRLLLGTFYTTSTTTTEDSQAKRLLANMYNCDPRSLFICPGYTNDNAVGSYTTSSTTWVAANGGTNAAVSYVLSVAGTATFSCTVCADTGTGSPAAGIGDNTTAGPFSEAPGASGRLIATFPAVIPKAPGYYTANLLIHSSGGGSATFYADDTRAGSAADPYLTFLIGTVHT